VRSRKQASRFDANGRLLPDAHDPCDSDGACSASLKVEQLSAGTWPGRSGRRDGLGTTLTPTEDAAACTSLGGGCDARISLKLRSGRTLRFPSHVADEELRRLIAVAETA
jgi:hypothetical protein